MDWTQIVQRFGGRPVGARGGATNALLPKADARAPRLRICSSPVRPGILLRELNAWPERWSDLADRLRSMRLASDRESVLELVETARGLKKLR